MRNMLTFQWTLLNNVYMALRAECAANTQTKQNCYCYVIVIPVLLMYVPMHHAQDKYP